MFEYIRFLNVQPKRTAAMQLRFARIVPLNPLKVSKHCVVIGECRVCGRPAGWHTQPETQACMSELDSWYSRARTFISESAQKGARS